MKKWFLSILLAVLVLGGSAEAALVPQPLPQKNNALNPYMAASEANIHNDCANTDVTDAVLPLGIFPEVNAAFETLAPNASPAIFYDGRGHAIAPLLGGAAIRDMDAPEVTTLGAFVPAQHDGGGYALQVSYSFVDAEDRLICPTSHGHIMVFRTMDAEGNVLPVFERLLDVDVKAAAEAALGRPVEQNLLSLVLDYEGNLWFATGGFRIYPERWQTGMFGYLSRAAIDAILAGGEADLSKELHFCETAPGEGAENGIASAPEGAVILTNQACYLLRAQDGVEIVWRTPYESTGAKNSREGAATTGGGLAWGGGASPSLSNDLVCFTDNLEPINLIALDIRTGERVAELPVLDELPDDMPASVENSIIVYGGVEDVTSVIVCNWFGASNAGLAAPDSDSSVQTYENIYDANWIAKGNEMIMPGIERADIVKTADGYEARSIWFRDDIRDTSMFKLSTATGYLYGYVQDMDSGMWEYIVLDFATGETVLIQEVSSLFGYNNMAIGMFCGADGNALYCPTGYRELLRLQDRFAYLPEAPYRRLDLDATSRRRLADDGFADATYLHSVGIRNAHPATTVAIRVNGLTGAAADWKLYAYNKQGEISPVPEALWSLNGAEGELRPEAIYEIHMSGEDGGEFDLNTEEKALTISVFLAR